MSLTLSHDASLAALNTFRVDCKAQVLARVSSEDDLARLRQDDALSALPRLVLGGGSNVLFTKDFPGLVLRMDMGGVRDVGETEDAWLVHVGAGENWHEVVRALTFNGRPGLENLALIPGLAGAAPIQNIGAYGLELVERLHELRVWDWASARVLTMSPLDCELGYRDSVFKRDESGARVILGLTLALPKRWQPVMGYTELAKALGQSDEPVSPQRVFEAVCALRRRKLPDPAQIGNAGSFFKNPVVSQEQCRALQERFAHLVAYPLPGGRAKLAAGWLIEACGLKGATRGRAGVYEKQALVLVNRGGASGAEILALAREIQDKVMEKFGVALEPEPRVI